MKKHFLAFAVTAVALATAGNALLAQNDGLDPAVLARLAAKRAAEDAGGSATAPAAPTPDTTATPAAADATATNDTVSAAAADTTSTNAADTAAADEARRKAAMQAALAQIQSNSDIPTNLQIIPRRNIFDPNRVVWSPTPVRPPPGPIVRVETFICTGTARKIGKGYLAMFNGAGVPDYPTELSIGAILNGFKIKDITDETVVLTDTNTASTNADFVLNVTQGLTRSDGGPWKLAYQDPVYATVTRARSLNDVTAAPTFQAPQFLAPTIINQDNSDQTDQGFGVGGLTGRTGRRGRNGGAGGGRRGGGGGGGFGGGTLFNQTPADTTPAAPPDPAVLARLQARRAAEGQ